MLTSRVLVVVLAAVLVPVSWQQLSPPATPKRVGFAVATVPSANDVWTWSSGDDQNVPRGPIPVTGVVPNRPLHQMATVTDISVWRWNNALFDPCLWWLRDGTTGQILYSGAFETAHGPNLNAGRDSVHLSTPIVLSPESANPPTLEFGPFLGTQSTQPFQYACTVVGRYVWNN